MLYRWPGGLRDFFLTNKKAIALPTIARFKTWVSGSEMTLDAAMRALVKPEHGVFEFNRGIFYSPEITLAALVTAELQPLTGHGYFNLGHFDPRYQC